MDGSERIFVFQCSHSDPALSERVEALAQEIAGTDTSAEIQELARSVAKAQIDLC